MRPILTVLAIAAALGICQCSNTDPLKSFEPEVTSTADSFQLQATNVKDQTVIIEYSWINTGARAKINHSTTTTAGTADLLLIDSNGALVYEHALVPSLLDTTAAGADGGWTVRLVLDHYSGTLNFRVQKL